MIVTAKELAAAEIEAREWSGAYRPMFLAYVTRLDEIMDDCRVMAVAKLEDAYWGAVRAWVDCALVFAADPAASIEEAHFKDMLIRDTWETFLSKILDRDGEVNAITMLLTAAAAEARKWDFGPVNDNRCEA